MYQNYNQHLNQSNPYGNDYPMQTNNQYNETPGPSIPQNRGNEMQFIRNTQSLAAMSQMQNNNQLQNINQGQSYYIPPKMTTTTYISNPMPVNTTSNNTAISSRLIELDTRISKYSDFMSINYGMLIWSILCFIGSIWSITNTDYIEQIIYDKNDEEVIVRSNNFNAYNVLCFFVNLAHCVVYFYAIRSYNKQSKVEMNYCYYLYATLGSINMLFFVVYIFFVHSGFFSFCINLIFLIFNVMLFFQSIELTRLYEEKEAIKLMYI